ncbi:transposase [Natranaerobius trueperi]|uniref:Transposase n=1 Tax=Natranaerobius trueperi TaxID=759412 RepID=A0A226BYL0_9FIRM|nr:transposase [Natranaerobius trueperi]OWZ83862.1 hypothetical protein CDO51_06400 [Natranaerobius trueperi]
MPKKFTEDYKREMVKLVTDLGKKPSEVAKEIGVSATSVRRWVNQYNHHGNDAFPGKGNLRPEDAKQKALEKKERIKAGGRDPKKGYGHLQQRREIKYSFIKDHSSVFPVKKMCQTLEVSRSAYYDWLKSPMSHRKKIDQDLY